MSERTWQDSEEDWSETDGDYDDDQSASERDDESGDESDDDSEDDSIPCPECGVEIYADLDHCPNCGHWLTDADRPTSGTGLFAAHRVRWIALALLIVFALSLIIERLIW
jgi:uncharacterized paraquat-inducible protein A